MTGSSLFGTPDKPTPAADAVHAAWSPLPHPGRTAHELHDQAVERKALAVSDPAQRGERLAQLERDKARRSDRYEQSKSEYHERLDEAARELRPVEREPRTSKGGAAHGDD